MHRKVSIRYPTQIRTERLRLEILFKYRSVRKCKYFSLNMKTRTIFTFPDRFPDRLAIILEVNVAETSHAHCLSL